MIIQMYIAVSPLKACKKLSRNFQHEKCIPFKLFLAIGTCHFYRKKTRKSHIGNVKICAHFDDQISFSIFQISINYCWGFFFTP